MHCVGTENAAIDSLMMACISLAKEYEWLPTEGVLGPCCKTIVSH